MRLSYKGWFAFSQPLRLLVALSGFVVAAIGTAPGGQLSVPLGIDTLIANILVLYIALYNELLISKGAHAWQVLTLWLILISRPDGGIGGLVGLRGFGEILRWFATSEDGHPSSTQEQRPGIELVTIESPVRRPIFNGPHARLPARFTHKLLTMRSCVTPCRQLRRMSNAVSMYRTCSPVSLDSSDGHT